jgi:hypothetical protein
MASDLPDVARPSDSYGRIGRVIRAFRNFPDQQIDFRQLKARNCKVEIDVEIREIF